MAYHYYDILKIKLLIIGGNRNFGYELIKKILKNKNIDLFVVNRNGKNLKILKGYKKIRHYNFDRSNQKKLIWLVSKFKIDLVIDNIAYDLSDIKRFINFLSQNRIIYIFSSTILTTFLYKIKFENVGIKKLVKKKYIIEKYLMENINNFIILRIHNILSPHDNSNRTSTIIFFNKNSFANKKIKPTDKIQFIFLNDLVKIIYNLISKNYTNILNKSNKAYNITNNYISFKNLSSLNMRSKYKQNVIYDDSLFKNLIVKNDMIDRRLKINKNFFDKFELIRKSH